MQKEIVPMPTMILRLPRSLKMRLDKAAGTAGLTPHAFILQAISESVESHERQQHFYQTAAARFERIAEGGRTVGWAEMKKHLQGWATAQPHNGRRK